MVIISAVPVLRVDLFIVNCLIPAKIPKGELANLYFPVKERARVRSKALTATAEGYCNVEAIGSYISKA